MRQRRTVSKNKSFIKAITRIPLPACGKNYDNLKINLEISTVSYSVRNICLAVISGTCFATFSRSVVVSVYCSLLTAKPLNMHGEDTVLWLTTPSLL